MRHEALEFPVCSNCLLETKANVLPHIVSLFGFLILPIMVSQEKQTRATICIPLIMKSVARDVVKLKKCVYRQVSTPPPFQSAVSSLLKSRVTKPSS